MTEEERKARKREQDKRYRETHKEQIKAAHKAWRDNNRQHLNEKARENYHKDPQAHKERQDRYRASHAEQVKASRQRYKAENRQKCTDYERNRQQTDPVYRFRRGIYRLINGYMKKKGYTGNKTTWEIIGCDFETFLTHIQSQFKEGMSIENYGNGEGKWSVDHIEPIRNATSNEDIERLNHYTNLRPLWSKENSIVTRKTP